MQSQNSVLAPSRSRILAGPGPRTRLPKPPRRPPAARAPAPSAGLRCGGAGCSKGPCTRPCPSRGRTARRPADAPRRAPRRAEPRTIRGTIRATHAGCVPAAGTDNDPGQIIFLEFRLLHDNRLDRLHVYSVVVAEYSLSLFQFVKDDPARAARTSRPATVMNKFLGDAHKSRARKKHCSVSSRTYVDPHCVSEPSCPLKTT